MASFLHDENSSFAGLNTPSTPAVSGLKFGVALFTPSPVAATADVNCAGPSSVIIDPCPSSVFSMQSSGEGDIAFHIAGTPDSNDALTTPDAAAEPRSLIDISESPIAVESESPTETRTASSSVASPEASTNATNEPSSEEIRRQIAESERLAWELMQQDSLDAFNMQLEFIRQNSSGMEEADLRALTQAMEEERAMHEMMVRRAAAQARGEEVEGEEEEEGEEGEAEAEDDQVNEEDDSANWTYDQLLALGEAVGDVKTERWRRRSTIEIEKLPEYDYICTELPSRALNYADDKRCAVCMEEYESDARVRLLPCRHFFHSECSAQWLKDHNACPSCKVKITSSP